MLIKNCFKEIKALDKGQGLVVIATLNVVDKDGDVTLPGAFGEQTVSIVPAHDWHQAPIGKARIREEETEALAEIKLNLETDLGSNWYEALKFDLDNPPAKQEYSYGFSIPKDGAERGQFAGREVRFLKSLQVHEISPVLLGAGVQTRTLELKDAQTVDSGQKLADQIAALRSDAQSLIARLHEIEEMRAKEGRGISTDRLKEVGDLKALIEEMDSIIRRPALNRAEREIIEKHRAIRMKMLDGKIKTI